MLSVAGPVRAVTAFCRALANAVVVTGMSHHVTDGPGSTGPAIIRIDVTCYPPKRIDIRRLRREEKARIIPGTAR
jgi:hypothetical protein